MTNYPTGFDNNITLPGVSGSSQEDMAITALRSAVFAIETELGVVPSGVYADVRARLDVLESRINFSTSAIEPGILNDGYVKSPLYIYNVQQSVQLSISDGYAVPTENRVPGSLYMRAFGTPNNELYVFGTDGYWHPIQTEQFQATHDLTGYPPGSDGHLAQTVIGLYNHPFRSTMNTVGAIQDGYHVTWNNIDGYWEAQTGFIPGRDLLGFSGPYGRTAQTVIGLQGNPISGVAPGDGYTWVWQASDNRWEPQARAVIFDGYVARVNLRSNRAQQSPIDNTKTGIVNLGTSTDSSGGTTGNYSMILGGDRNTSSGTHSLVVSGFANSAQDGYSAVISGRNNTAVLANSIVINGTGNTASGANSTVINGTSNTAAGTNTTVSNGTSNSALADFSAIFNGSNNTISVGSSHSLIYSGQNNQIIGGAAAEHSLIMGGDLNSVNSANNVFIGTTSASLSQGDFSVILSGVSNSIATLSDYAVILSGVSNTVSASAEFAIIGSGNNNTATFHHSTILNGDTCSVSGMHGAILNGADNIVTGDHSTIINGHNNSITGSFAHGLILDGYNNTVTGPGGFIGDGYNNTVNGSYSTILNGNFNTISGRNSTILNGGNNLIDANSIAASVLTGDNNSFINSASATVLGSGNTFTNAANHIIIGTNNNTQAASSFINGASNTLLAGGLNNRMFGSFNNLGANSAVNFIVGNGNSIGQTGTTSNTFALGSNNVIDNATGGSVNGNSNIVNANLTNTHGQFGKARLFGQEVRANGRFTGSPIAGASIGQTLPQATINVVSTVNFPSSGTVAVNTSTGLQTITYTSTNATQLTGCTGGTGTMSATSTIGKIGEAQWSRLILDGYSTNGSIVPIQLQDTVPTNPTFVDGYSYDMSIKVLIVNTSPISPNPVVPARYYIDVLAHQESGVLVLDNINYTLSTPNTVDSASRTPWTVSVTAVGNQMVLQVDAETPSSYVQPTNSPSNRRAIASIDMREISRI